MENHRASGSGSWSERVWERGEHEVIVVLLLHIGIQALTRCTFTPRVYGAAATKTTTRTKRLRGEGREFAGTRIV